MPNRMSLFGGVFALLIAFLSTASQLSAQLPDTPAEAQIFVDRVDYRLRSSEDTYEKHRFLSHLAPAALRAGDKAAAKRYSEEMLSSLDSLSRDFYHNKSVSIHMANLVLGLLAVEAGDTKKAKEHLLASATFGPGRGVLPAHPVLTSFGPSMELAKRLLEKGEKEIVLEYLDLCSTFWTYDQKAGFLAKWKSEIDNGEIPKFRYSSPRLSTWRFSGL